MELFYFAILGDVLMMIGYSYESQLNIIRSLELSSFFLEKLTDGIYLPPALLTF